MSGLILMGYTFPVIWSCHEGRSHVTLCKWNNKFKEPVTKPLFHLNHNSVPVVLWSVKAQYLEHRTKARR